MSSQQYAQNVLKMAIAQICQRLGWDSTHVSAMDVLTDVTQHFLREISRIMHTYCELNNRTEANLNDLALAYNTVGVNLYELMEYIQFVDPILMPLEVQRFPVPKKSNLEPLMRPVHMPPVNFQEEESVKALLGTVAIAIASTMTTGASIGEVAFTAEAVGATITSEDGSIVSQAVVNAIEVEESPTAEGDGKSRSKPADAVKDKSDTEQSPDGTIVSEDGRTTREVISVITTTSGFLLPVRVGKLPVSRIPIIPEEQPIPSPPAALQPTLSQTPPLSPAQPPEQPATSAGSHATLNSTQETIVAHEKYPKKMKNKRSVSQKKKKRDKSSDRSGSRKRGKVVARSDEKEGKLTAGKLDPSEKRARKRNKATQRADMAKTLHDQGNSVVLRQSHMLDYFPVAPKSHQKPPPLIVPLSLVGCTGKEFGAASVVPTSMHYSGGETKEASLFVSSVPRDAKSPSVESITAIPRRLQGKPKPKRKTKRVKMGRTIGLPDILTPGPQTTSAQQPQLVSETVKTPFAMHPDTISSIETNPATFGTNLNQSTPSELGNPMPFGLNSEPGLISNNPLFPRQLSTCPGQDKPNSPMSWHPGMDEPFDSKTKLTQTPLDLHKPSCNVLPLIPRSLFQSYSQLTLGTSTQHKAVSATSSGQPMLLPAANALSEANPYQSSTLRAIDIDVSTSSKRAGSTDLARISSLVTQPPEPKATRVNHMTDVDGNTVWICPPCGRVEDGTPMIACDACDDWYHWACVGIQETPGDNEPWYCRVCIAKKQRKRTKKDKKRTNNKKRERGEPVGGD